MDAHALQRDLESQIEGEVRFDTVSRALYSTDASVYQIEPIGVVVAKSTRRHRSRRSQICRQHRLSADDAGRRHVAGRPGDRRGPPGRHVEVFQPAPRGERRRALGARRAGHRARRAERRAAAARPALRARHLDRQPRHHRRHDGEQLERRAVGAVRQDDRSRARAAGRAVGRIGRRTSGRCRAPSSTRCAQRRHARGRVLPRGAPARAPRTPTKSSGAIPKVLRRVGGYNLDAFVDPDDAVQPDQADGRLRRHARRRPRSEDHAGAAAEREGGAGDPVRRSARGARSDAGRSSRTSRRRSR